MRKREEKSEGKSEEKLTEMEYKVFNLIKENPAVTYAYITDKAGVGETSVYKIIKSLKDKGWIKRNNGRKCGNRNNGRKCGNWVIMKKITDTEIIR